MQPESATAYGRGLLRNASRNLAPWGGRSVSRLCRFSFPACWFSNQCCTVTRGGRRYGSYSVPTVCERGGGWSESHRAHLPLLAPFRGHLASDSAPRQSKPWGHIINAWQWLAG